MDRPTCLVWLRNDLRLADNPALAAACDSGMRVVALFIHETDEDVRQPGAAARWWLNQSLEHLSEALGAIGIPLVVREGKAGTVIDQMISEEGVQAIHWNRRYAPGERALDSAIKDDLQQRGFAVASHMGNVLAEPWTVATGQGKPYSVFTPFRKNLRQMHIDQPLPAPDKLASPIKSKKVDGDYQRPFWAKKFDGIWVIGEAGAHKALETFLDSLLDDYPQGRDFPAEEATSRLSPHLRHGEISPRQVWHATLAHMHAERGSHEAGEKFLSEISWRDFNYHQLYHREDIANVPMQEKYAGMKWEHDQQGLVAWQEGRTGIPMVDAGMRELWATGFMQNRVRMLTASFLVKNLLIDWRIGERWFWDCLCDGDVANNPANWQWVAGSGLDAAPYFRIFNPVTQGTRFDKGGDYVRRWVPELAKLPDKHIQDPANAPKDVLKKAGIELGKDYPLPIADLKQSRERALERQGSL
ncbi:deoxyribodipyrimidine photo-lyase [Devosia crocina]|uniref:Deoxyribodipyrimidine photo-lyase n=1 Tax=Devosia crocina TaxID=429728 RepID=A0A1I7NEE0_9HYPH|nr:deoxyribodipyrimidine photo-lyase [Devosia crocina]SFV33037.1 deoxyribodipyrimidine photo-lyase [Devosia crocina]